MFQLTAYTATALGNLSPPVAFALKPEGAPTTLRVSQDADGIARRAFSYRGLRSGQSQSGAAMFAGVDKGFSVRKLWIGKSPVERQ